VAGSVDDWWQVVLGVGQDTMREGEEGHPKQDGRVPSVAGGNGGDAVAIKQWWWSG
jgi:hypothetical protein